MSKGCLRAVKTTKTKLSGTG